MGLGDYVKAAKIAAGLRFRPKETTMSLKITGMKALKALGVALLSAAIVGVSDAQFSQSVGEALKSIPFGPQIATAVVYGLLEGLRNLRKHWNTPA
jgi:hypothetical protein